MSAFEIYQESLTPGQDDEIGVHQWRWRLKADNNEIIAVGEGYTRKDDARRAVETFKLIAPMAEVVVV